MKDPHDIILRPHITEKSMQQSYGDPLAGSERELMRKYTFIVASSANKIEIKQAIEQIYNAGKKKNEDRIEVVDVHTSTIRGKKKRINWKTSGYRPDRKKAVITLGLGQMLEDYGV